MAAWEVVMTQDERGANTLRRMDSGAQVGEEDVDGCVDARRRSCRGGDGRKTWAEGGAKSCGRRGGGL